MRRRGIQCLWQTQAWLKVSLQGSWCVDQSAIAKECRVSLQAGGGSCASEGNAKMVATGFHHRREYATRGYATLGHRSDMGRLVPSWSSIASFSTSLDESDGEGDGNGSDGEGGSYSERSHDEIVGRFEKLLQKWSSNTPLLLDNLQVQLNPVIVCRVLKKIPKSEAARKFFNWAKSQKGYQHNVYTYTAMIDHYGRAKNYAAVEQVVAEMRDEGCGLSIVTFSSLMHWYRQAKNLAGVRGVWQYMHKEGCQPNEYTYTTYIDALAKGGCHQEAMEAFKSMQDSGCRPNIFTYTVLIHALVEAGKLDGACALFENLADLQDRPNSVTYTILIRAHGKARDLDKAIYFYKSMMNARLTPSLALRSFLCEALVAGGRASEAEELTQISAAMVAENEKRKAQANAIHGSLPRPEKLAELLRDWGPKAERVLERVKVKLKHPYLMNVLSLLSGEPEVAWRFFEWLKVQEGYTPTKYLFTKVMDIIGKAGHTQLQREILEKAATAQEASTVAFNTLIKSYCDTKHSDAALQVFEHMKEQGLEPNSHTYTMLIDVLSRTRNHNRAMKMYGQMVKANVKPTMHTYTVVIHSLARSRKVNAANTLFEKLPSLGITPSTVTYTILLQAFLKEGDVERALKLYEGMRADGVTPSRATLRVLARGLHAAGMHDEADALSHAEPYFPDPVKGGGSSQQIARAQKDVRTLVSKYFL